MKTYTASVGNLKLGDKAILNCATNKWFVLDDYFKDKYNPTQEEIDMFFMISGIQIKREENDIQFFRSRIART